MSRVIGIDLGTTNSCVAILDGSSTIVIPNTEGGRTTPSVVGLGEHGELFVGQIAQRQAAVNPKSTIQAVKRLIGQKFDSAEVQEVNAFISYDLVPSENGDAWIRVNDRGWSPAEISAKVLEYLKNAASDFLGEDISLAVITVPAYFNDAQRQATRDAGRIAGLEVLRVINEPTAAALAYGLGKNDEETIVVYDLGGGTFDVSILQLGDGLFEVIATNGNTFLGGEDFDNRIVSMMIKKFLEEKEIDLSEDSAALQRLKEAAEIAKRELSRSESTDINLPFIAVGEKGPTHLAMDLTREEFEKMVEDLVEQTLEPCRQALADTGLEVHDISKILLVGGMTRMPLVRKRVTEFFQQELNTDLNPDEVIAMGAAIQGGVMTGELEEVILLDVTPLSLGIETMGGTFTPIISRNTPIPTQASEIFSTTLNNQNMVSVHVLQGERPMAADNHSLARFELHGIPPGPRGMPQIEVAFNIDSDGIFSVGAQDLATGQMQQIRVIASGGINEEDIFRMIDEADTHRSSDANLRERMDLRNHIEGLIYTTKQSFAECSELIEEENQELIQKLLDETDTFLLDDELTLEELQHLKTQMEQAAHHITEAMYGGFDFTDTMEEGEEGEEGEGEGDIDNNQTQLNLSSKE